MRRDEPLDTVEMTTAHGPLRIPALDEMIGMKAYLTSARNATRDYLDFAALSSCAPRHAVLDTLLKSDRRYGSLQTHPPGLEIAKRLADPRPYDLDRIQLDHYKGLRAEWASWEMIAGVCRGYGVELGRRLVTEGGDAPQAS